MVRVPSLYLILYPLLIIPLIAIRSLRESLIARGSGLLLAAILIVAVAVRFRQVSPSERGRLWGSAALLVPFALFGILWVGIATPWKATFEENRMRYLVLMVSSVFVALGFVMLAAGNGKFGSNWSLVSMAGALLAGSAFLVWSCFQAGVNDYAIRHSGIPESMKALNEVLDALLFAAGTLHYLATASLAIALAKCGAMGKSFSAGITVLTTLAVLLLLARGLSFPDPTAPSFSAYHIPGFVAGIPAVPWLLTYYLAAILLCNSNRDPSRSSGHRHHFGD